MSAAIERQAVRSSNLISIGYDPLSQELHVEFAGGRVYRYRNVPSELHDELVAADSVGRFFAARVRPAYPGERIG